MCLSEIQGLEVNKNYRLSSQFKGYNQAGIPTQPAL